MECLNDIILETPYTALQLKNSLYKTENTNSHVLVLSYPFIYSWEKAL